MIPFQAIVVPLFILMKDLGLNNTYLGLIVPESLTAFGVFLMRQFLRKVFSGKKNTNQKCRSYL